MHRINLTPEQTSELEDLFRNTKSHRLRNRCQAILMAARGRSRAHIAEDLQVNPRTVRRWILRFNEGGIEGLAPDAAPGQPRKISPENAELIRSWVEKGPAKCGLDRANWTFEELAQHLWRTKGIRVSYETVRRCCLPQRCKEKWQQGGEVGRIKANGSPSDLFNMSLEAYPNLFRFCAASLRPYSSPAPNALAA